VRIDRRFWSESGKKESIKKEYSITSNNSVCVSNADTNSLNIIPYSAVFVTEQWLMKIKVHCNNKIL